MSKMIKLVDNVGNFIWWVVWIILSMFLSLIGCGIFSTLVIGYYVGVPYGIGWVIYQGIEFIPFIPYYSYSFIVSAITIPIWIIQVYLVYVFVRVLDFHEKYEL